MALGSAEHGSRRRSRAEPVPPLNPNDAGFLRELAPELGGFVDRGPHRHITAALSMLPTQTPHQPSPPQPGALSASHTNGAASKFTLRAPAVVELGGGDAADDWEAPDDVEAALQLLAAQFPAAARAAGCGPLMLKNQLYALVEHRTTVDRRLDSLRESGVLRMFKLSSGTADDYAYLFAPEYADLVRAQRAILQASGSTPEHLLVLDWFLARVAPHAREAGISHIQLLRLLSEPPPVQRTAATHGSSVHYGGGTGASAHSYSRAGSLPRAGLQSDVTVRAHKRPRVRNLAPGSQSKPEGTSFSRGGNDQVAGVDAARKSPSQRDEDPPLDAAARQAMDSSYSQRLSGNCRTSSDSDRAARAAHGRLEHSTAAGVPVGGVGVELPIAVTDAHISLLLNGGIIARHPQEANSYLFSVPIAGPLVKSIAKGRVELLGLVTRRRYSEMREKDLEGHSLQRSLMDMRFHVRDLIGMGALQRVQTTSGTLLRAPKRK